MLDSFWKQEATVVFVLHNEGAHQFLLLPFAHEVVVEGDENLDSAVPWRWLRP